MRDINNMKSITKHLVPVYKKTLLSFVCVCFSINIFAQAPWEVNVLRSTRNTIYPTNTIWKGFSSTAKPIAVAVPFGMMAIALINENHKLEIDAYETVAALAVTTVVTEGLKLVVKRDRPYKTYPDIIPDNIDDSYSFPSGHTSVAFSAATSLFIASHHKWYVGIPAFAWAAGVGYSRIYLGQHYPSDVIAGGLTGIASAYATHWLNKKLFKKK